MANGRLNTKPLIPKNKGTPRSRWNSILARKSRSNGTCHETPDFAPKYDLTWKRTTDAIATNLNPSISGM